MRLNVNTGPFAFEKGVFQPEPSYGWVGPRPNPRVPYGKGVYSGLLLVGLLERDGKTKIPPERVIQFVKAARIEQAGDPGSSFIFQRGLYKHRETGEIVDEPSLRIIVLHLTNETRDDFRENILGMAEAAAAEFNQAEVIVEFQNRGVTDEIVGVKP